jgi:2-isopropylmalate synthase
VVLRDYRLRSVTLGEDAQGEALIEAEHGGKSMTGRAISTDVIEASAEAFLQVINRLAARQTHEKRIRPTENPS